MDSTFSIEKAKEVIDSGIGQAQELIKDPSRIDELLVQLEEMLRGIPTVGTTLSDIPQLIAMVKAYITKEYSEVSPKVIVSIVSAFLYLVKKNDLIPDSIPLLGRADDIAVLGLALKLVEPELAAFKAWREGQQ